MRPRKAAAPSYESSPDPLDSWAGNSHRRRAYLISQLGPQPTDNELHSVERAIAMACIRLTAVGTPISVLATGYLPAQRRWIGLCLADSEAAVRLAASNAQLHDAQVVEV